MYTLYRPEQPPLEWDVTIHYDTLEELEADLRRTGNWTLGELMARGYKFFIDSQEFVA